MGVNKKDKINWLPINNHLEQSISSSTFKLFNNSPLAYMNNIFRSAGHPDTNTRTSFLKPNQPLRKTNHGQKDFHI